MNKNSRIYVTAGNSFIGQAINDCLNKAGYKHLISEKNKEPNLCDRRGVDAYLDRFKPEYVFLVAGRSAGIMGNTRFPAELMLDNLLIECNIIDAAFRHNVKKLLYLASSCCYPKHCRQPMKETDLLTGLLEPTNEPYAVAKLAGLKLVQSYRKQYGADFICGIPANIFGPGDDFTPEDSHVMAALIRKMHEAKARNAKEVVIWGTGRPRREFIYREDLARACLFIMRHYSDAEPINLGCGSDVSIRELALLVKKIVGFRGKVVFDPSRPDGMPAKFLEPVKLKKLGWKPKWPIEQAITQTYEWFTGNATGENGER